MNDSLFQPVFACVIGTGVGMLLSVAGQKALNKMYQAKCPGSSTHQLVYSKGFLGDTYYCVDKRYL
jgi:hypothetical protein